MRHVCYTTSVRERSSVQSPEEFLGRGVDKNEYRDQRDCRAKEYEELHFYWFNFKRTLFCSECEESERSIRKRLEIGNVCLNVEIINYPCDKDNEYFPMKHSKHIC